MTSFTPFFRKIIYLACIGVLLIPLSLVSRPGTREANGKVKNEGGKLSALREEHDLAQAKIADIDPTSETMKLASLGLRGVAVNLLWMQAIEHKKKGNYDQLRSTLEALTKIQPNFVKVWEYQAHNLAYNVSVEFDDYESRYAWVKKGLAFLKKGIPYNRRDHRIIDKLGFHTGIKFGKSDEKTSFRRLFRKDDDYHQEMADRLAPESYDLGGDYGPDSWKMAYQWYAYARELVDKGICQQKIGDTLYHMYRPAQLRNMGMALQTEFKTSDTIQEIWAQADREWKDYGQIEITNTLGITTKLNQVAQFENDRDALREELDEIVGKHVRDELMAEILDQIGLNDEQREAMDTDGSDRTDAQIQLVRSIERAIVTADANLDTKIALQSPDSERKRANRLALEINKKNLQINALSKDSNTVNYRYWLSRNEAESKDLTVAAREATYDAEQMWRQSIYDDEYDFNFKTKEKTVTKRGGISLFVDAFEQWNDVFEEYPILRSGELADSVADSIYHYKGMLDVTNREWPDDHPLQKVIDFMTEDAGISGVPTTEDLEERRSGREEEPTDDSDEDESDQEDSGDSETKSNNQEASDSDQAKSDQANTNEQGSQDAGTTENKKSGADQSGNDDDKTESESDDNI